MIAVIAGATGLVGSELVKELVLDSDFTRIIVYSRKALTLSDDRLIVIRGELSEMSARRDELKGDVYFSCLGTTMKTAGSQENFRKVDFHAVVSFGRIAYSHKARKLIVVSASGANSQSKIFYSRVKGETEKALKDIGLSALVIFRPGLLIGHREEKRTSEKVSIKAFGLLKHLVPLKLSKSLGTDVRILVRHMISAAKSGKDGLSLIEASDI
jgi:uncharacterized protein YbjT (DUF2867 family)